MASEKKVIFVFSPCDGKALLSAETPALKKLRDKGVAFNNVACDGDLKIRAACGTSDSGETLWDAARKEGLSVAGLHDAFDLCTVDTGASVGEVESLLADILEVTDRTTLITLVAPGLVIFYGPGMAKGKVVEKKLCACSVAPTVAYAANFPVPEGCEGAVAYTAFKDVNLKFHEIKKLQEAILNMEAAVERKSRQPWDKHDCA